MISTSATVFVQLPESALPELTRRFRRRYESVQLPDGRVVLQLSAVGVVLLTELGSALRLQYVAADPARDFAARSVLESAVRRELRRRIYTIAWEELRTVPVPLR